MSATSFDIVCSTALICLMQVLVVLYLREIRDELKKLAGRGQSGD